MSCLAEVLIVESLEFARGDGPFSPAQQDQKAQKVKHENIMFNILIILAGRCMALDREFAYNLWMCISYNDLLFSFG